MYRYTKEELSTSSSEDETSTTGTEAAAAAAATTTADMCRVKVRNGKKVVVCNACGYESDRRANVTRHYGRIHDQLEPKKYRKCTCGLVFQTKDQFYDHCEEFHPNLRQSSYTTTHVYKMNKTKARRDYSLVKNPYARSDESDQKPPRLGRIVTRSSARLLRSNDTDLSSLASCSSGSDSSGTGYPGVSSSSLASCSAVSDSFGTDYPGASSSSLESCSAVSDSPGTEYPKTSFKRTRYSSGSGFSDSSFEYSRVSFENAAESTRMELPVKSFDSAGTSFTNESSAESSSTDSASENEASFDNAGAESINNENAAPSSAPLPIKKRYLQSYNVLEEITNNNVQVQQVNDFNVINNNQNRQMSNRELYFANVDENNRSFLRNMNIDEVDAVLALHDLKYPM